MTLPPRLYRLGIGLAAAVGARRAENGLRAAYGLAHGEPELRLVRHLADPARLAVDVGAAEGVFLALMARHAAGVVGFEPNPAFLAKLRARFPAIRLESCALSDCTGEAELRLPRRGGRRYDGHGTVEPANPLAEFAPAELLRISVPLRRLDDLALPPVGLIKIDVEGHEQAVVAGGLATIRRDRPNLLIEIEERHHAGNLARLAGLLGGLGYAPFFWHEGRLRPVAGFESGRYQDPRLIPAGGYVNNFLFLADPGRLAALIADAGRG